MIVLESFSNLGFFARKFCSPHNMFQTTRVLFILGHPGYTSGSQTVGRDPGWGQLNARLLNVSDCVVASICSLIF